MPTSNQATTRSHTTSTQCRFLHMAEKDFAKRRQQSLQASILEAVCLERLVQDIDERLVQSQRQHQWLHAHKSARCSRRISSPNPSCIGSGIMPASPHSWLRKSSSHTLLDVPNIYWPVPPGMRLPSEPSKSANHTQLPPVKRWHLIRSKYPACSNE